MEQDSKNEAFKFVNGDDHEDEESDRMFVRKELKKLKDEPLTFTVRILPIIIVMFTTEMQSFNLLIGAYHLNVKSKTIIPI